MSRLSLWLFVCVTAAAAPQPTTTSLTVVSGSPVYASVLTFEAAVDAQLGSVTFVVDGQPMSPQVVDGRGLAFLDYSFAAGSHTVTANYSGSAGVYLASSATPLALAIAKATPTVSILSGPAQIGQPTTLTAAIVPPGAGVTLGTVAFAAGGSAIAGCGAVVVQYRSATCTTNFPALGSLTISATYGGDANTTAASGSVQVLVSQVVAGVYVASTPVPAVWGQSITVRALVLGAQNVADPTGTVTFSAAGRTVATQPLGTDGRASLTATYDVGSVALAAKYNGDTYYQPAAAVGLSLSVGKAPTVLTISNDPAQIGQPVVLRASVALAAGSGSITGTVDFTMDGKPVAGCVGVPLTAGRAACQTSFGTLTGYTLGGAFSGDGNTLPSTASLGVAVNKAAPGVYLATAPSAPVYGQTVSLDALVLGATGVAAPSGSVAFMENGRSLATPPLDGKGSASALVTLAAGAHVLTAVYSGDSNYQSLASGAATVTVGKAATVTELAAVTGGPFTATVTVASPGAGTPSGLVQFRSGGAVVGTAPLVAQNSVYTAVLPSSNATGAVTAVYGGDANFAGSSSNAATVYAVQTIVSLTSDQNPARAGQAVVVTAAVSVTPRALNGAPSGTVALAADGVDMATVTLAGGQAMFHLTLATGSHALTATYSGDAVYPAASGSLTQVVAPEDAVLTLGSSAPAAVYGQPITLTAVASGPGGGLVQFSDGAASLGTLPVVGGSAALTLVLATGVHKISATWGSLAAELVQTVNAAASATSLGISGGMLIATVGAVGPGAGVPGGSIRFLDAASGAILAVSTLSAGAGGMPIPAGSDAIVAAYSGDANFLGGISATLRLLVATNAASYASGSLAPDELATLFAPRLPTSGVSVKFTDSQGASYPAALAYAGETQATIVTPSGVAAGPAILSVSSATGTLSTPVTIAGVAPGLFTADGSGQGAPAAEVLTVHADGSRDDSRSATLPISLGGAGDRVYVVLYGTGIRHAAKVVCTVRGESVDVVFAGAQGSIGGLDQLNLLLPSSLAGAGDVALVLTVDGQAANEVRLVLR